MTIELRKEIESELRKIYSRFGFIDQSVIDRKIAGQFRMMAVTDPKMVVLDDGHKLIGNLLFVAMDSDADIELINRDGEVCSKKNETWLVLLATEVSTWLLVETLDRIHPLPPSNVKDTLENGVWKHVTVEEAAAMNRQWIVLY